MKKISKKISGKQVEIALILIVLVLAIYIVYRFATKEKFATKSTLRVYMAEWCGHSTELLKESGVWETIKIDPDVKDKIIFEKVDCDSQPEKCTKAGINGLPTIKLDDAVYGERPPTLVSLKKFILDNVKKPTTSTSS